MSQSPPGIDLIDLSESGGSDAQHQYLSLGAENEPNDNSSRPAETRNISTATRWKIRVVLIFLRFILPFFPEFVLVDIVGSDDQPSQSGPEGVIARYRKVIQVAVCNLRSFGARCIHLFLEPRHLAPPILDFFSFFLTVLWNKSQHGPDMLYPLTSLKKQKSERLARLLTDHSRDPHHQNLHVATSRTSGVDPPRVVVIDLNEVPEEITKKKYTASADFHGFCVVFLLHMFASFFWFMSHLWIYDTVSEAEEIRFNYVFFFIVQLRLFMILMGAAAHGNGTVTLVRRSDVSVPGCAVLLDRDLTIVLMGPQNIVEAIGESGFAMSLSASLGQRHWQVELGDEMSTSNYFYNALIDTCKGIPSLILAGLSLVFLGWLRLSNVRDPATAIAMIPFWISISYFIISIRRGSNEGSYLSLLLFFAAILPLRSIATDTKPAIQTSFMLLICLQQIIAILIMLGMHYNVKYQIRIAKFLDVLGHPPVRRWEFNTLAAAATFQCLAVCHGIPRPVKNIDVLGLLDTFVLDDRDVWKAWKNRVADRIAHEVDILFTPTIPTFGDPESQQHLKQLLDEAQEGYQEYRKFYDHHVPLYSTS